MVASIKHRAIPAIDAAIMRDLAVIPRGEANAAPATRAHPRSVISRPRESNDTVHLSKPDVDISVPFGGRGISVRPLRNAGGSSRRAATPTTRTAGDAGDRRHALSPVSGDPVGTIPVRGNPNPPGTNGQRRIDDRR